MLDVRKEKVVNEMELTIPGKKLRWKQLRDCVDQEETMVDRKCPIITP